MYCCASCGGTFQSLCVKYGLLTFVFGSDSIGKRPLFMASIPHRHRRRPVRWHSHAQHQRRARDPSDPGRVTFLEVSTEGKALLASNCPIKRGRHKADATAGGSKRRLPPSTQSVTSVTVYTTVFTARHRTAALGDHSATLLRPSMSRAIPAEDARLRRRTQARGAAARCWSHPCRP